MIFDHNCDSKQYFFQLQSAINFMFGWNFLLPDIVPINLGICNIIHENVLLDWTTMHFSVKRNVLRLYLIYIQNKEN